MLHASSERIASYFVSKQIIEANDSPIYAYGIELLLASILNAVVVLGMGIALGRLVESILFLASFAVLRSFCGGYHAESHGKCLFVLIAVYIINLLLLWAIPPQAMLPVAVALSVIGSIFIVAYAPVANENKPLDHTESRTYRLRSRLWWASLLILAIGGQIILPSMRTLFFCITLGSATAAVSTAAAVLQTKINKSKGETT